MRSGRARLLLQRLLDRARPRFRRFLCPPACAFFQIALRLLPRAPRGRALLRRRQLHSRSSRLGKADRDRLLGRARSMFSFANMLYLFAHKFPGLGGRGFPFPLILAGSLDHIFFWHDAIGFAAPPIAGCRKVTPQAIAGRNRRRARIPPNKKRTSTIPCTIAKGRSDPVGARRCKAGIWRKLCTTRTKQLK